MYILYFLTLNGFVCDLCMMRDIGGSLAVLSVMTDAMYCIHIVYFVCICMQTENVVTWFATFKWITDNLYYLLFFLMCFVLFFGLIQLWIMLELTWELQRPAFVWNNCKEFCLVRFNKMHHSKTNIEWPKQKTNVGLSGTGNACFDTPLFCRL